MKPLKIGISGVRGVVGETLTPDLVVGFAQAFGTYLGPGRILVCRDSRPSGPMVGAAVAAGLLATGCDVVDLGICPTPSLQLAVRWLGASGGISITAGHNPAAWNALKFVRQRRPLSHAGSGRGTAGHLPPGPVREGDVGPDPLARGAGGGHPAPPRRALCQLRPRACPPAPVEGRGGLLQRLLLAALTPLAGRTRLRGADDQRRPVEPVSPLARASSGVGCSGAGDGEGGSRRRGPRPRRGRRAPGPRGRNRARAVRGDDPRPGRRDRPSGEGRPCRHQRVHLRRRGPHRGASRRRRDPDAGGPALHLRGHPRARRGSRRGGQRQRGRAEDPGVARQRRRDRPAALPPGRSRA